MRLVAAGIAALILCSTAAEAYTGRRAVVYTRARVMLAENLPWAKQDCSSAMWRLLRGLWPELRVTKWFRRTTAHAMTTWPWQAVMSRGEMQFGDLIFTGHPRIKHVLMHWTQKQTAVHASSKRGFSATALKPYWWPKIEIIVRPPY